MWGSIFKFSLFCSHRYYYLGHRLASKRLSYSVSIFRTTCGRGEYSIVSSFQAQRPLEEHWQRECEPKCSLGGWSPASHKRSASGTPPLLHLAKRISPQPPVLLALHLLHNGVQDEHKANTIPKGGRSRYRRRDLWSVSNSSIGSSAGENAQVPVANSSGFASCWDVWDGKQGLNTVPGQRMSNSYFHGFTIF